MNAIEHCVPRKQYRYYYLQLTSTERKAYDRILGAFLRHESKVRLEDLDLVPNRVWAILGCIRHDVPEVMQACRVASASYKKRNNTVTECTITQDISLIEHSKRLQKCAQSAQQIVNHARRQPAGIPQVKAVYDWFVSHCKYDYAYAQISHTAYGALVLRKSVCEGFCFSAKMCFDRLGIPCIMVQGYNSESKKRWKGKPFEGDHAWLMVHVNGAWYHLDASNDVCLSHSWRICSYGNFLLSDDSISRNHSFNASKLPHATKDYGYYARGRRYVESERDLHRIIGHWDTKKPLVIQFKPGKMEMLHEVGRQLAISKLTDRRFHGSIQTSISPEIGLCCYTPIAC